MRRRWKAALAATLASMAMALSAAPALASFHEMVIREVYPGSIAQPDAEYVELQMWAPGQNLVNGHAIKFFDATGAPVGSPAKFSADVSHGANQSTILAATPAAESAFGVVADLGLAPSMMKPEGGAVCWPEASPPDCVSWGNFSGNASLPAPGAGTPVAPGGIPDGMALRRSIARGCGTLLEVSDDTHNSAADFEAVFPSPRPNSVTPTEHACGGPGPGGSSAPQTTLRRKPPKGSTDRTPTFRFTSNQSGATFECKLDGKPFRACRSPFTTKKLSFGGHTVKVRAKSATGQVDGSPASFSFKVLRKPR